jgi:hypothetical protein
MSSINLVNHATNSTCVASSSSTWHAGDSGADEKNQRSEYEESFDPARVLDGIISTIQCNSCSVTPIYYIPPFTSLRVCHLTGSDMTSWCSAFDSTHVYVDEFLRLDIRDPVVVHHIRLHWAEPQQDFGPRCAPSVFEVRVHNATSNRWVTVYARRVIGLCKLKKRCIQYPNSHPYNVQGWTVTHVNVLKKCGDITIDAVMIKVTRFARHWATCSVSRVEVVGPARTPCPPVTPPPVPMPRVAVAVPMFRTRSQNNELRRTPSIASTSQTVVDISVLTNNVINNTSSLTPALCTGAQGNILADTDTKPDVANLLLMLNSPMVWLYTLLCAIYYYSVLIDRHWHMIHFNKAIQSIKPTNQPVWPAHADSQ